MSEGMVLERMDALLRYRDELDGSEKELFDLLMGYADDVAASIYGNGRRMRASGC